MDCEQNSENRYLYVDIAGDWRYDMRTFDYRSIIFDSGYPRCAGIELLQNQKEILDAAEG